MLENDQIVKLSTQFPRRVQQRITNFSLKKTCVCHIFSN